jgi:MYXO-CTERM domain-containing protein
MRTTISSLTFLFFVLSAASARADAIEGPPACPPGARGQSAHEGQWCVPALCESGCGEGETCAPRRVCVQTARVIPGGLRPTEPPAEPRELVVATCEADGTCTGGEEPPPPTVGELPLSRPRCDVRQVCVPAALPPFPPASELAPPLPEAPPSDPPAVEQVEAHTRASARSGCGCSVGSRAPGGLAVLVLLALTLAGRRRGLAVLALLLVAAPASAQLPAGWSRETHALGSPRAVACSRDRMFALGYSDVFAWSNGHAETLPRPPASGYAIASSPSGVLAVSLGDAIALYDQGAWTTLPIVMPPAVAGRARPVSGLRVFDAEHVYFVSDGAIGVREGDHFALYSAGTWRTLEALDGTGPRALFAVGQGGTVMHWDGEGWTRETARTDAWLRGVAVVSPSDTWAWSDTVLFHRDEHSFASSAIGSPVGRLVGVVPAGGGVFAVGERGIARWSGTAWTPELTELGPYDTIAGACATDASLFVATGLGDLLVRAL